MLCGKIRTSIIGGGSITWMPTFLNDLANCPEMRGGEVVLYDIDLKGQDKMARFGRKLFKERDADIEITVADTLEEALTGADFVVCTVLIGSHEIWKDEMNIIHKYGIEHPKGMSVGPGGLLMGLKQAPWIVELAKMMEQFCPNAWLLNFSNPMQVISLAVERYSGIKYLGLCHGVTHTVWKMAQLLGEDEKELNYTLGGVNHFEIIKDLSKNGVDLLPKVADAYEKLQCEQGYSNEMITCELYRLFDGFPCNEDIHVMEFLPYYTKKGGKLEDYEQTHNFIENRMKGRISRWSEIDAYLSGELQLGEVVEGDSGEKLNDIIRAVVLNQPTYMYVNVTNRGYIKNLQGDMCVEVPVVIHRNGYEGVCIGDMPKALAALSNLHGSVQDLIVDAAMNGDRHAALQALSLDPMCYTLSLSERQSMLGELIDNSIGCLPRFRKEEKK